MKGLCVRLILIVGLTVTSLDACRSNLHPSAETDLVPSSSPAPLVGPLGGTESAGPVPLVRIRGGESVFSNTHGLLPVAVLAIGGIYEPITHTVIAPVLHFSRYALCVE
jgi:hypothetical protein